MNPNLLKQLAIVVKQGSLSRACEQLYITQPTLTRSLQQLEAKVGAPLLIRSRYGVAPTEIGARLAQIGERILADAEHGEEVIRQWHSGYQSEFSLGIDPLWEFATFDSLLAHLMSDSRYVFHLRTGSASVQIALLLEKKIDFLLAPAHLTVAQGTLERELLFRDRSAVFAGANSQLIKRRGAITREDLEKQCWMIAGASAGFLDGQGELAGPHAAKIAFTGSIRSVIHLLQTTDLLVRLPARLALMTGEIDPEQMLDVETQSGPRRDIALWSHADQSERPENVKVREFIREYVKALDQSAPIYGLDL